MSKSKIDQVAVAIDKIVRNNPDGAEGASAVSTDMVVSLLLGTFVTAERREQGSWPGAIESVVTADIRMPLTEEKQVQVKATADVTNGVRDLSLTPETEEEQKEEDKGATAGVTEGLKYFRAGLGIDAALLKEEIQKALDLTPNTLTYSNLKRLREENLELRQETAESLEESPIYGTHYHDVYFDESDLAKREDIKKIRVRSGKQIYSIRVCYQSQEGNFHGSTGAYDDFDLEDKEKITIVAGTIERDSENDLEWVSSLTFSTDFGKEKTFGKKRGEEFIFKMTDGSYLGAIKGFEPKQVALHAIGFIPKRNPQI